MKVICDTPFKGLAVSEWVPSRECLDMERGSISATSSETNTCFRICIVRFLMKRWVLETTLSSNSLYILPTAEVAPLSATAVRAPIIPVDAVTIWARAASHRENPDLRRMAKSPTSWGISWRRMARVVKTPWGNDTKKLPPTARPWVKLSNELAIRLRYPLTWQHKMKHWS